ncbi:MAG: glucosaminidase domain-containing protein [Prevotella sp.]|nr:glucosaminidase domain-containing protein [Prevotella sp.]MCM1074877.1 glucosaminidase domain-containing protein [Ruminococcus sp.]
MKTKFTLILLALMSILSVSAPAQKRISQRYTDYIEKYAPMAVEQQHKHGIPASVTLAQGLLESAAGQSTLATQGNNHFGIKCHASWTGPSMLRDDDAPDECFRVYADAAESFEDHSLFLAKGRRYAFLFNLEPTDYRSWAQGLSSAGYATDPNYAPRLISIIEQYGLYIYDRPGGETEDAAALFIMEHLKHNHVVRRSRGLHYVIAVPGDTYASLATEFNVDPAKLVEYNDASSPTEEIKAWEEVYFQPKLETAPNNVSKVTIGQDESAHSIAQRYGMKMSVIQKLNPGFKDEPGTRLKLK